MARNRLTRAEQIKSIKKAPANRRTPRQFTPALRKRLKALGGAAVWLLGLGLLLFSSPARAQTCPVGTVPIPGGVFRDEDTDQLHEVLCRDRQGKLYLGSEWHWIATGTFTNTQNNPNLSVFLGGMTAGVAYAPLLWGSEKVTDGLTVGMAIPSAATVYQANGIASYMESASSSTNAVGGYFHMRASGNGAKIWGSNPRVGDYDSALNVYNRVTLIGEEIDVNARNAGTSTVGLLITGGSTVSPTSSFAIHLGTVGPNQKWGTVLQVDDYISDKAIFIGARKSTSSNSQWINLRGRDSGGNPKDTQLQVDSAGDLLVTVTTGAGGLIFPGNLTRGATATAAAAGSFRLQSADQIRWRNSAGSGDVIGIYKDSSDVMQLGGSASGVKTNSRLNISSGVAADGSGLKHARTAITNCATTGCEITVTWGTAFADANYTPVCSVLDATAQAETTGLRLAHIRTQTAAAITVDFDNLSGAAASGTLNCIAVHD